MLRVGLTGGIGTGKSTVADLFSERGVPIVDTDLIARQLVEPGMPALEAIRAAFGESVMQAGGALDRAALRKRVFADASARKQLESILHPLIRQAVRQALDALDAPYVVVVIPLLVETDGYGGLLDRILVVDCPEDVQIARVMARSGLSREEVQAILDSQARRSERLDAADDVIANSGSPDALHDTVAQLDTRYRALSAHLSP